MPLDVAAIRQHISTPLEDEALERLLTAAYEAIADRIGAEGDRGEVLHAAGPRLMLSRRASAITSIVERYGSSEIELETDDYELRPGGRLLWRLRDGTNPAYAWRGNIDVRYPAFVGEADRDRVAIALINLDINHAPGVTSEKIGDWSATFASGATSYQDERAAVLDSLYGEALVLL